MARLFWPLMPRMEPMLKGYDTLLSIAGSAERVVPGHDPLVTELFPSVENTDFAWRLDKGPIKALRDRI